MVRPSRSVAHQQEQRHGHGPEGDELRVAAGHAIAFSGLVDALGPLFFDEALEGEVDGLAGKLAGEHEHDLGFARGPDQGDVDDAEGLGHEGQPGAEVGDGVGGVLLGGGGTRS